MTIKCFERLRHCPGSILYCVGYYYTTLVCCNTVLRLPIQCRTLADESVTLLSWKKETKDNYF